VGGGKEGRGGWQTFLLGRDGLLATVRAWAARESAPSARLAAVRPRAREGGRREGERREGGSVSGGRAGVGRKTETPRPTPGW